VAEKDLDWKFAEELVVESDVIRAARAHSLEHGVEPISPAQGAQLAVLTAATNAKTIIEVGTGFGISGLWMFTGAPDATLTSIEIEIDFQQSAKRAFADFGIPAKRARLIAGRALEVLPRMNESSYDIVLVDADPASVIEYVEHALRLVRVGGTVVVPHALWRGRVADPAQRDETVTDFRTLLGEIAGSSAVLSALSLAGDGLLQLTRVAS
jgi:predicted O-methyltransferase YrrM